MSREPENSLITRPSLLARLKCSDENTAWDRFHHDYAPLLHNVARKAGLNDSEADEVTQETLIGVAKKIGEFRHAGNRGSFRAWLYQQARWRIADQFRLRAKHASAEEQAKETGDPEATNDHPAVAAEDPAFEEMWNAEWEQHVRQLAIERVKRRVSARQFQLFDLHVLQGLGVGEAARAAGTSMAAVYMAKSRIARIFKRELKLVAEGQDSLANS